MREPFCISDRTETSLRFLRISFSIFSFLRGVFLCVDFVLDLFVQWWLRQRYKQFGWCQSASGACHRSLWYHWWLFWQRRLRHELGHLSFFLAVDIFPPVVALLLLPTVSHPPYVIFHCKDVFLQRCFLGVLSWVATLCCFSSDFRNWCHQSWRSPRQLSSSLTEVECLLVVH